MWRLRSDLADREARSWTRALMRDCAAKVVALYAAGAPELLLDFTGTPAPAVDPALPATLAARADASEHATTLAGFLRHRRAATGLSAADVAEAALLPLPVVTSWEDGAAAAPSQLIRCAPVLQLPEETLIAAGQGLRDADYWPLPTPPPAALGRR
ncbi:helix-turn-helix domain-containing protein [Amycolatopsis rubida]|uniref:Helix-turn-helix domain-containing protein n=1 Tax=Amycolatopsis rubida TaxID=112413 RepID=A0A1I5X6D1_9PSEU|nr:helix-turn-helix domain-containing protein [Amycolatopsis rubida]SFQ27532.1 Helix-turn-helix domain-containing protein [Amycolatopsis rubida]